MRKLPGVQPGTIKHVILQTISELGGTASLDDIYHPVWVKCQSARRNKMTGDHLIPMVSCGILNKENGKYTLTADGYWEVAELNNLLEKKRALPVVPPNRTPRFVGTYTGSELGRTSFRPGAYDAYDKPSIINGVKK